LNRTSTSGVFGPFRVEQAAWGSAGLADAGAVRVSPAGLAGGVFGTTAALALGLTEGSAVTAVDLGSELAAGAAAFVESPEQPVQATAAVTATAAFAMCTRRP